MTKEFKGTREWEFKHFRILWWHDISFYWYPTVTRNFYGVEPGQGNTVFTWWKLWVEWGW